MPDLRDEMMKYIADLTKDLINLRANMGQNIEILESRIRMELEEHQLTLSTLYYQKGEVNLKLQHFENRLKKMLFN